MEKKTIAMLVVSAVILILGIVFACGIGRGGEVIYQKPGPYAAERSNDYSNVQVAMTIQGDEIIDAEITSSGDNDLLTDDIRAEWAQSIVDNQSYENDVISSATLVYSAESVKQASADIFTQVGLPTPEPAATPEPEPEAEPEAPSDGAAALADGNFHVEKTTDFSTIDVGITVEGGAITDASVASSPLEGQVDLLTDDIRDAWARQIVEKHAVDAVSGVTISSNAVQEAVGQLMVQVNGGEEAAGLADGTYSVRKTTDFSTIDVEMTVEGGKVTAASITSEGANDLLTDDHRAAWADQIVNSQTVDTVSGVTISSEAVQEAVAELMTQAAGGTSDIRIAELEAALADAEARAEAAEARAAELETANAAAEAKIAELEAAAAALPVADETQSEADGTVEVPATKTADSDISRFMRPRPAPAIVSAKPEDETEETPSDEAADSDISRFVRPRPVSAVVNVETENEAEEAPSDEAADADISRFVRPRPAPAVVSAETEDKAEEAPADEAADSDISRFVRPRPISAVVNVETENEAEEAPADEAADADISRFMRPRPAPAIVSAKTEDEAEEAPSDEASNADISRFMRPRPAPAVVSAETEDEAEETPADEAADSDISRFMRPRPVPAVMSAEAEDDAEEAPSSETSNADISRFMRPRPTPAVMSAKPEDDAEEAPADEATDADISRFIRPRPVSAAMSTR